MFTQEEITRTITNVLEAQHETGTRRLAKYKASMNDCLSYILSSAILDRYRAPKPKYLGTNTTVVWGDIIKCISNFSLDVYYKLPLVSQQFVYFSASLSYHPFVQQKWVVENINKHYEAKDIILPCVVTKKESNDTLCKMCGLREAVDVVCYPCMNKLIDTIQARRESFVLYGTSYKDFSINVLDFKIDVKGKCYTFTLLPYSRVEYEPLLPFVELQNDIAIL